MRIFVTGASGWIGSAVIPELLSAGHAVVGLARSDAAAEKVAALGVEVRRGELDDVEGLRAAAADADGVVHLGYNHDFSDMPGAARTDRAALTAMAEALEGTGAPLVMAAGTLGLAPGRVGTEDDMPDPDVHPRVGNVRTAFAFADRGVRPIAVRFAPTVHGPGDHGFIAVLVGVARERGFCAYIGDGANRWPAVHRLDAARLVARAVDHAPAGTIVHATAEDGVPTRAIAEAIGRGLDLPVRSIAPEQAAEHFGWIGAFFGADAPASSIKTRALLGWEPTHATLIEDLDAGAYF
jgi:nucleoside-diphosphate-sugar epimerase